MPSQAQIRATEVATAQRLRDKITALEAENASLKARLPKKKPAKKKNTTKK